MTHILRRSGLTPQQTDKLDKDRTPGRHLLKIINAILDLSKIRSRQIHLERFPHVGAILENSAAMLAQSARRRASSSAPKTA